MSVHIRFDLERYLLNIDMIMTKSLVGIPRSDELPPLLEPQESSEGESSES